LVSKYSPEIDKQVTEAEKTGRELPGKPRSLLPRQYDSYYVTALKIELKNGKNSFSFDLKSK